MIDLMQWRATIGSWYCPSVTGSHKKKLSKTTREHEKVSHLMDEWWIGSLKLLLQAILIEAVILSYSIVMKLMILLLLCGDVESNPGPIDIELTANKALNILQQSGFNIPEKWNRLAGIIGISISERKNLLDEAQTTQDYHFALEQALDSWITNAPQASWEGLLSAVEQFETDSNVICTLRRLLNIDDRQKLLQRVIQIPVLDWKRVGIHLAIEDFHIQRIDNDERGISNKCTVSMFQHWLNNDTSFSTYKEGLLKLANVLEKVEQRKEASELKLECGIPQRKRSAKYETSVASSSTLNIDSECSPSKKGNVLDESAQSFEYTDFRLKMPRINDNTSPDSDIAYSQTKSSNTSVVQEMPIATAYPHLVQKPQYSFAQNLSVPTSTASVSIPYLPSCSVDRTRIVSIPQHEVSLYQNYLKVRYIRNELPTYFKQPSPSIKQFIHLVLVYKKHENTLERVQSMTAKLHGNVQNYVSERMSIDMEQICKVHKGEKLPRNVLIEGDPGVGKTTLVWEMCKQWGEGTLLQQWNLVILVQLRDKDIRRATNLRDFFKFSPDSPVNEIVYQHIRDTFGDRVLIIFDGYDELSKLQKTETSIFHEMLESKLLPSASVIVTSRPVATATLPDAFKYQIQQHIEVVGFTKKDIDKYIKCKFSNNSDLFKSFKEYISSHQFILTLMYVPLHCALVSDLYQMYWRKGKRDFAPKTVTELYSCFLHSLLERYVDDHPVYESQKLSVRNLSDLPRDVYDDLMKLAQLAAKGIEEEQYVFDDLTCNTLGLMQNVDDNESHKSKSTSYSFLHLTLQEYLAALFWSTLPSSIISELFLKLRFLPVPLYSENHTDHLPALFFYGGLTNIKDTEMQEALLFHCHSTNDLMSYNFRRLLFESQNSEYISSLLTEDTFYIQIISHMESYVTGYCIANSSSAALWNVEIKESRFIKTLVGGVNHSTRCNGGSITRLMIKGTLNSQKLILLSELQHQIQKLVDLELVLESISHSTFDKLSFDFCPNLKVITVSSKKIVQTLNCSPLFAALSKLTSSYLLNLGCVIIDGTSEVVSTGLRNAATLKSLKINDCGILISKQVVPAANANFSSLPVTSTAIAEPFAKGLQYNTSLESIELTSIRDSNMINTLLFGLQFNISVSSLTLSYCTLDVEGGKQLRDVMRDNTTLRKMVISETISSMDIAQLLAEGLQCNAGLQSLQLNNILDCGVITTLMFGLLPNKSLSSLTLNNVALNVEGGQTLSIILKNCTLKKINLDNSITQAVAESLQYNSQLEKLQLQSISDNKVVNMLMNGLMQSKFVSSLTLDSVALDVEEGEKLGGIINNTALRKLKIKPKLFVTFNVDDFAKPFAESLQCNTQLETLQLLRMSGETVNTLMFGLIRNKSVSSLTLGKVALDAKGGETIREVMKVNNTVKKLRISTSINSTDVAQYLAEGLQYNTGLHTLSLHQIYSEDVMKTLIEGISCNHTIQTLALVWNRMTIEDYQLFSNKILKSKHSLQEIVITDDHIHAEVLADGLSVNTALKIIAIYSKYMSSDKAKLLADSVMKTANSAIKMILPDHCSQELSKYHYPKDRIIFICRQKAYADLSEYSYPKDILKYINDYR